MLFPSDPVKRPELWTSFEEKLRSKALCRIVRHGVMFGEAPRRILDDVASKEVFKAFKSADIVRFGARGTEALGPYWAFRVTDGMATLVEYLTDSEKTQSTVELATADIESVAINLYFERPDIVRIVVPFSISSWTTADWKALSNASETVLERELV